MRDKDIQEALDYTVDYHDPSPKCAEHLDNLADAYREKCEEYNRLLEVAESLKWDLVDASILGSELNSVKQFEELIK